MYKLDDFFAVLDKYAPLSLSKRLIEKGDYDNSGIIVKCSDEVTNVLFCLDLTKEAIKKAKRLNCNTIVTHHPAIYLPIKSLSVDDSTSMDVLTAIENKMNVISMHLNLDIASNGIDESLAKALGAKKYKKLDCLDDTYGYGREFTVEPITLKNYVSKIKKELKTNKVLSYGKQNAIIKKVASFCGAGANYALAYLKNNKDTADLIVTADIPHHIIKELIESGKNIAVLTHYSSENYGFDKYFLQIQKELKDVNIFYFDDKRFN